jgi:hypothetical protein
MKTVEDGSRRECQLSGGNVRFAEVNPIKREKVPESE